MKLHLFFVQSVSLLFSFSDIGNAVADGPIVCTGDLPPGEYGDPEYYPRRKTAADFPGGINQFCQKKRGVDNMAAYCNYNLDPPAVVIDYFNMDNSLYNPVTYRWCPEHCRCVPPEENDLPNLYAWDRASVSDSTYQITWQQGAASSCRANRECVAPRRCVLRPQRNTLRLGRPARTVWASQCAGARQRPPLG